MIQNDQELHASQERISYFYQVLAQMRVTETGANFPLLASGYLAEVKKMHAEVMEYLGSQAAEPAPEDTN